MLSSPLTMTSFMQGLQSRTAELVGAKEQDAVRRRCK